MRVTANIAIALYITVAIAVNITVAMTVSMPVATTRTALNLDSVAKQVCITQTPTHLDGTLWMPSK